MQIIINNIFLSAAGVQFHTESLCFIVLNLHIYYIGKFGRCTLECTFLVTFKYLVLKKMINFKGFDKS